MKQVLLTQAYYDANTDLIQSLAHAAGIGNFEPIPEGALLMCRGIDPADLLAADVYHLPEPLTDEGQADYRARIATAAVGAFNAVKNGPKECFAMEDEQRVFDCRAATGWPKQVVI